MRWYRKLLLNATLAGANVLFFGGAIWVLTAGARVRKAGWLDVFEDQYPFFHTGYVLLVVLLSLLVATLAISGLYSVLFKRKEWVLLVYAGSSLLTLAVCVFLVVEGGISLSTARAWRARPARDAPAEAHVEANFNQVYCLSQAAFLCTAASNAQWLVHFGSDDLRDLYLDSTIAAKLKQAMAAERTAARARSLLELCEDETSPLHVPTLPDRVANLCTWCGDIADLKSYVHLVAWANTKCPPTRGAASFCVDRVWLNYSNPESTAPPMESSAGVFVATGGISSSRPPSSSIAASGDQGGRQPVVSSGGDAPLAVGPSQASTMTTATILSSEPYVMCRKTFLSYWASLSLWFLLLSLAMLVFMLVVIRVAWIVLRGKPDRYGTRHGRKPERKPLVQLASRAPANEGATSTARPSSTTGRRTPKGAAKPSGPVAKAKVLLGNATTASGKASK